MRLLPRLQLFELEDQSWFPATIRDLATDYLQFVEDRGRFHESAIPILAELLEETEAEQVVDLCSGGAGPWLGLERDLRAAGHPVRVTLTDKFPHLEAFLRAAEASEGRLGHSADPVDAMAVPKEFGGVRTLFNSFHHFPPREAKRILRNAVEAEQPIAIFEIPDRTLASLVPIFLLTPAVVALATPFMRPLGWKRLVWTYLLPAVPFTCFWDGVISQFRAYTPEELRTMGESVGERRYRWRSGKVRMGRKPLHWTYLTGIPEKR